MNALVPERLMVRVRARLGDMRTLTSVDPARRRDYVERVERQAKERGASPPT